MGRSGGLCEPPAACRLHGLISTFHQPKEGRRHGSHGPHFCDCVDSDPAPALWMWGTRHALEFQRVSCAPHPESRGRIAIDTIAKMRTVRTMAASLLRLMKCRD